MKTRPEKAATLCLLLLAAACAAPAKPITAPADRTVAQFDLKSTFIREYPNESIRLGEEGDVKASALCNADGHITDSKILVSTGYKRLDNATLAMVAPSRCFPALDPATGQPIASWIPFAYHYALK
ncbi:MAG: energy transducer TonB [Azospirillaceae bacterium]|nr:energy transducer TonB [Azospirillaceae bacterium]